MPHHHLTNQSTHSNSYTHINLIIHSHFLPLIQRTPHVNSPHHPSSIQFFFQSSILLPFSFFQSLFLNFHPSLFPFPTHFFIQSPIFSPTHHTPPITLPIPHSFLNLLPITPHTLSQLFISHSLFLFFLPHSHNHSHTPIHFSNFSTPKKNFTASLPLQFQFQLKNPTNQFILHLSIHLTEIPLFTHHSLTPLHLSNPISPILHSPSRIFPLFTHKNHTFSYFSNSSLHIIHLFLSNSTLLTAFLLHTPFHTPKKSFPSTHLHSKSSPTLHQKFLLLLHIYKNKTHYKLSQISPTSTWKL